MDEPINFDLEVHHTGLDAFQPPLSRSLVPGDANAVPERHGLQLASRNQEPDWCGAYIDPPSSRENGEVKVSAKILGNM